MLWLLLLAEANAGTGYAVRSIVCGLFEASQLVKPEALSTRHDCSCTFLFFEGPASTPHGTTLVVVNRGDQDVGATSREGNDNWRILFLCVDGEH